MLLKSLQKKIYFLIFFILTGCSHDLNFTTVENKTFLSKEDPLWQAHLTQLQNIQNYKISGQLGYITPKKRASATFNWNYKSNDDYQLELSSSLNLVNISLNMTKQGAYFKNDNNKEYYIKNLSQFLQAQFGFLIPIEQLSVWIKGQPLVGQNYQVGENHLLAGFDYQIDGIKWHIQYLTYSKNKVPMPETLLLKSNKQTIKIRINNWQL